MNVLKRLNTDRKAAAFSATLTTVQAPLLPLLLLLDIKEFQQNYDGDHVTVHVISFHAFQVQIFTKSLSAAAVVVIAAVVVAVNGSVFASFISPLV